jgi:type I restriction enzyme, R subunit
MTPFSEVTSAEGFVRDRLCGGITHLTAVGPGIATAGGKLAGLGWFYLTAQNLGRNTYQVLAEGQLRDALIRLNPEIAGDEQRADDVLHRLRSIIKDVRTTGLVRANEEFTAWLTGERSMPFGPNGEHVTVRLVDFDDLQRNQYVVTNQFTIKAGATEKRGDLVLLVNGIPLVVIEAKTPIRAAVTWFDGAVQIHDDYEKNVPELFVPNLISVATEGKELRYGSIGLPLELWGPWKMGVDPAASAPAQMRQSVDSLLRPETLLDLLASFTAFSTDSKNRRIKIVARYQQVDGANRIVERVVAGHPRKGLVWHFQGSGKSLLMLFAARKLRLHPRLGNPTVLIVVDRIDLDAQIAGTFLAADVPNLVKASSRAELQELLAQDSRKVIITTIFKFGEAGGVLNDRSNIVALVDEAHRTQEGDLGRAMRTALPKAFLFGMTGTPINRVDHNTFYAFGAEEDAHGYLSRYSFDESIRDGATKPLHFEPRLLELHIDRDAIDADFRELTGGLTDLDRDRLGKAAARLGVLVKAPERVRAVCADIAAHFQEKVAPNGFGAMVVTYDRESCVLYKRALDEYLPADASDIVMTVGSGGLEADYSDWKRDRDAEEKLLNRFRDPADPLKILIVTAKLLTGFDAPILQAMYLDKPMRDHTLLQAICRANRPYRAEKTHGLIVDYLGIFDDVAAAISFDEAGFGGVISNFAELIEAMPAAVEACLAFFPGVDRTDGSHAGLEAAHDCVPDDATRDRFAAAFTYLARLWEAVSPDPVLTAFEADYRWLAAVYESLRATDIPGKLLWHALGAKTVELIHEHVHVEAIRDDLETLILDAELIEAIGRGDPGGDAKARGVELKIAQRLRARAGDPRFKALGERLEDLRKRHEQGLLVSVAFLKELLELAKDVVSTEATAPPMPPEELGKAALTELFESVRTKDTAIIVERVVTDIDEIVRVVRFAGWQNSHAGERQVKQALRRTLLKYRLHQDQDLFERAYAYIRQYY